MNFGELLSFRKMITPTIIQVVFLLGLIVNALSALGVLISSFIAGTAIAILGGLITFVIILILGSILIRVYCELLILAFRIYDELKAIRTGTPPPGDMVGFPVTPTPAAPAVPPPHA